MLPSRFHPRQKSCRGFTLVEILVATSVLALMGVMMAVLTDSASQSISTSGKHLAADDQARQVFDRMQVDFTRMLKRNDIYFSFSNQAGNDQATFYSETRGVFTTGIGTSSQSNLSLVSYQFNSLNQLTRAGQGYQWSDIAFSPTPATVPVPSTSAHILSNSVFRMDIAFIQRTSNTTFQITSIPTNGSFSSGSSVFPNLTAIIVAIGVLDPNSQKLVSSYSNLVAALPEYTSSQTLDLTTAPAIPSSGSTSPIDPILSTWRKDISNSSFATTAGIPATAAQQVRIYQRIFYLQ
jgi:prepilin-type N-terminal cleavage/methylation domain-containing protein